LPEGVEKKTLKPDESQPQKANNETDITFIEGEAMQSLEDGEKIALYTEAIKRLNAIIGHELDDTGKMAIISAVLKYPKYIACDPLTKSEIAVPVTRHNKLIAVLDVDGTEFNSFNEVDKSYLELIVRTYFED
jgi:hypothetical protein